MRTNRKPAALLKRRSKPDQLSFVPAPLKKMSTTETRDPPTVEEIFAEMIERRAVLSPIVEDDWDAVVVGTPRWKRYQLERRMYTPFGRQRRGDQYVFRRLWRMEPGLYELVSFDGLFREATLRKNWTSVRVKVRLPLKMEWPWKATHLKIGNPGEDPVYPRGKAEWVRL